MKKIKVFKSLIFSLLLIVSGIFFFESFSSSYKNNIENYSIINNKFNTTVSPPRFNGVNQIGTTRSILVNFKDNTPSEKVVKYTLKWFDNSNPTEAIGKKDFGFPGVRQYKITNLEYEVTYKLTLIASDKDGNTSKESVAMVTMGSEPLNTPTNFVGKQINDHNEIQLNWEKVDNAEWYLLAWKSNDGDSQSKQLSKNSDEYRISNLEYDKIYQISLIAKNNSIYSDSNPAIINVGIKSKSLSKPIFKESEQIGKTKSIKVSFKPNPKEENVTKYTLTWFERIRTDSWFTWKKIDSKDFAPTDVNQASGLFEVIIEKGINYNQYYKLQVVAINLSVVDNTSPIGETYAALEPEPLPSPINFNVKQIDSTTSVIATWDNVENAKKYVLTWWVDDQRINKQEIDNSKNEFIVENLEYGIMYKFILTAVNYPAFSDSEESIIHMKINNKISLWLIVLIFLLVMIIMIGVIWIFYFKIYKRKHN